MIERKRTLGIVLISIIGLWILTWVFGIPVVEKRVETRQAESDWGEAVAAAPDSMGCRVSGRAVGPLLVAVREGCWRERSDANFGGGYEKSELHLWLLAGELKILNLWLAED